ETVTLEDASNGNAVVGTGILSSGSVVILVTGLTASIHNIFAVYAGDTNYLGSMSGAIAQTVLPPIAVSSVVVNGNNPGPGWGLAGSQRSMVDSVVYTFNQAVNLTGAVSLAVHTGQTGSVPTLAVSAQGGGSFDSTWIVTFSGSSVTGASIADGVYDITLAGAD